jgi:multidrug efflux pump subunit AcrB
MPLPILLLAASCATGPPAEVPRGPGAVTVRAYWNARSAEHVVEKLAAPLEAELRKIPGVTRTVARSNDEGCSVRLYIDPAARPANDVAFDAGAVCRRVQNRLPKGARAVAYAADTQQPPDIVFALVIKADKLTPNHYATARDFAHTLLQLPAAVRYHVRDMPVEETVVQFDPARAKRWEKFVQLTAADVAGAIEEHVVQVDEYTRVIVTRKAPRGRRQQDNVGNIVLKSEGRQVVRIRDVARVRKVMAPPAVHLLNGEPAILVDLYLLSDAAPAQVTACLNRALKRPRPDPIKRVVPLRVLSR